MQNLVRTIVDQLVDDPANVDIDMNEKDCIITIFVEKCEIGRVIGKQGRIARAIRSIVESAGKKQNLRYSVKIEERN